MFRLYAVTDRAWTGRQTLAEQVEAAILGGVTCVQLREKELDEDELEQEAREIAAVCRNHGVPLFINDSVRVALAIGADGIHVGQNDANASDVRTMIPDTMMLGVSVHTVEQALQAQKDGADCLGVGAMFSTDTKKDAGLVSFETLKKITEAVDLPVVAIGGISQSNMTELKGTGIAGAALVSAIFKASDIEATCRALKRTVETVVST